MHGVCERIATVNFLMAPTLEYFVCINVATIEEQRARSQKGCLLLLEKYDEVMMNIYTHLSRPSSNR